MRKSIIIIFLSLGLVLIASSLIFVFIKSNSSNPPQIVTNTNQNTEPIIDKSDIIKVDMPLAGSVIMSPVFVRGQARGNWFFEGSFPIFLTDANDNVIAQGLATSTEDWMTENFIPFTASISYQRPNTNTGKLILKKDNPSGLPEYDDQVVVPVNFDQNNISVKVFFTTPQTGNEPDFDCQAVTAVTKQVAKTEGVARAALEQLLIGPSSQDRQAGFGTSINPNVKIQDLSIVGGVARVDFNQQLEYQVGGSCRVASIAAQIIQTLKQFPTVQSVVISIDGRTEDILQP